MLHKPVETAKAAGLEPRAYPHYLFETPQPVTNPEVFKTLLPHRITPGEREVSVLVL